MNLAADRMSAGIFGGSIQHDGQVNDDNEPLLHTVTASTPDSQRKVAQIGPCRIPVVFLIAIFSFGMVFGRVATFASTPLWLDSVKTKDQLSNSTTNSSSVSTISQTTLVGFEPNGKSVVRERWSIYSVYAEHFNKNSSSYFVDNTRLVSAYYVVLAQQFICSFVFGISLLVIICFQPEQITDRERQYPKWRFLVIGSSMALSSILVNSATSGTKTAPYLQAILMNFNVPITFSIRFLILRKRPTLRKLLCAGVVVLTEFVCMIPTIFPNLESQRDRRTEGGGQGAGRIIWPFIFVLSQVPYAVQSTIIEKVTKDKTNKPPEDERSVRSIIPATDQIHMVYFLFWTSAFTFLSAVLFFWTQLIPEFSDVTTFTEFGEQLWFNMQCQVGGGRCTSYVTVVSSLSVGANLLAVFSIANLLRWSEGANYMMVISTIRTPTLFLFWTLFEESPFRWLPHASLSTWLSIGAILVMLPAVYAYSTGPPEHDARRKLEIEVTPDGEERLSSEN